MDVLVAYKCTICKDYLYDPQLFQCCKKSCCKPCILPLENKSKCPCCGVQQFDYESDEKTKEALALRKFQLSNERKCANKCGWKGIINNYGSHLNIDPPDDKWLEGCPQVKVQCIYCRDESNTRQELKSEVEETFPLSKSEDVYQITKSASDKWKLIGRALRLGDAAIEEIKSQCERDGVERCYCKLIEKWIESTQNANWCKLIGAFRHHSVKLEKLAKDVEKSILCEKSAEQGVTRLSKKAHRLQKEYKIQREQLLKLNANLKQIRTRIEIKTQQLKEQEARLSQTKEKQQGKVGEELSTLTQQIKVLGATISTIRKEKSKSTEEEVKLQKQIGEIKGQIENTVQCMNDTKIELEEEIIHLKWEGDAKFKHVKRIAAVAAGGVGAVLATTAAGVIGGAVAASGVGIIAVSGVAVAAYWWWPRKKSTQTQTRTPMSGAKYKELIDKCEKVVEALKMNINEWQGNLSRNKELA